MSDPVTGAGARSVEWSGFWSEHQSELMDDPRLGSLGCDSDQVGGGGAVCASESGKRRISPHVRSAKYGSRSLVRPPGH